MTIQELRKETGLSQSQFAKKFDIPVGTLQHWEQGIRKPPEYVLSLVERVIDYEGRFETMANETRNHPYI